MKRVLHDTQDDATDVVNCKKQKIQLVENGNGGVNQPSLSSNVQQLIQNAQDALTRLTRALLPDDRHESRLSQEVLPQQEKVMLNRYMDQFQEFKHRLSSSSSLVQMDGDRGTNGHDDDDDGDDEDMQVDGGNGSAVVEDNGSGSRRNGHHDTTTVTNQRPLVNRHQFLTDHLLTTVFQFLSVDDIINGLTVCKQWYNAFSSRNVSLSTLAFPPNMKDGSFLGQPNRVHFAKSIQCGTRLWTGQKTIQFIKQFIRNVSLLDSIVLNQNCSLSMLLHLYFLIQKRVTADNEKNEYSIENGAVNRVKTLSLPRPSLLTDHIPDSEYISHIVQCFPQIVNLHLGTNRPLKMVEILRTIPHLKSLTVDEISFVLPRELRNKYRADDDEEEDDEEDEEDYGFDLDEGLFTPSSVHGQYLRASADMNLAQTLDRIIVLKHVSILTFILSLQTLPNLRHVSMLIDLDLSDAIEEETRFFVDQLNKCPMHNLKSLEIRLHCTVNTVPFLDVIKSLVMMLARTTSLEYLFFDISSWNDDLNKYLLDNYLNKLYEAPIGGITLKSIALGEPSKYSGTFVRLCDIMNRHHTSISRLCTGARTQSEIQYLAPCTNLTRLSLCMSPITFSSTTIKYIESLVHLEELEIKTNANIDFTKLPKLHTLALHGKALSMNIVSDSLQHVNLINCSAHDIRINCPKMQQFIAPAPTASLTLMQCTSLTRLVTGKELFQCHLEDCRLLSVLDLGNSTSLMELDIVNCPNIRSLTVSTDSLVPDSNSPLTFLQAIAHSVTDLHFETCEFSSDLLTHILTGHDLNPVHVSFKSVVFSPTAGSAKNPLESTGLFNSRITELSISHLPNGSNHIPFRLLSRLVPNVQRVNIMTIEDMNPQTRSEMITAFQSWSQLNRINFDHFRLSREELASVLQQLDQCHSVRELRIKLDSFQDMTLPASIAETIETLDICGYLDPNHIQFPCLKNLYILNSTFMEPEGLAVAAVIDSFAHLPVLEKLVLKGEDMTMHQIASSMKNLVERVPNLKSVNFKLRVYSIEEHPDFLSSYRSLLAEYPHIEILINFQ